MTYYIIKNMSMQLNLTKKYVKDKNILTLMSKTYKINVKDMIKTVGGENKCRTMN